MKTCPFRVGSSRLNDECDGETCMWWVGQTCAVVAIYATLVAIHVKEK